MDNFFNYLISIILGLISAIFWDLRSRIMRIENYIMRGNENEKLAVSDCAKKGIG